MNYFLDDFLLISTWNIKTSIEITDTEVSKIYEKTAQTE